jgi:hypothetical protein
MISLVSSFGGTRAASVFRVTDCDGYGSDWVCDSTILTVCDRPVYKTGSSARLQSAGDEWLVRHHNTSLVLAVVIRHRKVERNLSLCSP